VSLISRSCANIAQVLPKCKCYLLNVVSHITISISADRIRRRFGSVGNVVGRINEVNQRWARLVLGWVTVCRRVSHLGMYPGPLSLAIPPWVGAMSTSKSWDVNRHTARCTSPVSVVWECKLVSG